MRFDVDFDACVTVSQIFTWNGAMVELEGNSDVCVSYEVDKDEICAFWTC